MIITQEFKIIKTFESLRSVVAHHRPAIEVESYTEEPISLNSGESKTLTSEKGLIIVSETILPITGDITVNVNKFFACFSALNITITNPADNEDILEARAYIF